MKDEGFTLLELIISIALLGIIVIIIVGTMRLASRSIESGERRIEASERMRASLNIVDSQIQSFTPLTYEEEGEVNRKYYFKGGMESMQFATNFSIWGGERGYVIATYTVKSENGKQVLYASEQIVGTQGSRETKLFDIFDRVYFEYFYKEPTEQTGKWRDHWTSDTVIPDKVRLHLIDGNRDLPLTIPFRAQKSATFQIESGLPMEE